MRKLAIALLLSTALAGAAHAVISSTFVGNANYTALSTDQRIVYSVPFTAPRTLTLNSAGATCIGQTCGANAFSIYDTTGVVSATNTLSISAASGETINGSSAAVVIAEPFGVIEFFPTSGTNWVLRIYAPGQYPGTTTNDNAPAGSLGEYITGITSGGTFSAAGATNTVTSAPNLTTTVAANLTQVLLSAGDWDCRGQAELGTTGTGVAATVFAAWTSTSNQAAGAPIPSNVQTGVLTNPSFVALQAASVTSPLWALGVPPVRYSLAAATSVYLNTVATFSAGTATGMGQLGCRRVR